MNELTQSIQSLPFASLVVSTLLVVIGLILWAAGRRVLKPSFAALALIAGAALGWLIGSRMDFGVPPWAYASIIALLCMCFAALAFRALIATSMALVVALAAPLALWGGAELRGGSSEFGQPDESIFQLGGGGNSANNKENVDSDPENDEIDNWLSDRFGDPESEPEKVSDQTDDDQEELESDTVNLTDELQSMANKLDLVISIDDNTEKQIVAAGSYARAISDWAITIWNHTPENLRFSLTVTSVVGGITGLLMGVLASSFCISIVTSFGGSMLWLASTVALAREMELSENLYTQMPPETWLLGWVGIAIIGLVIQWIFRPAKADNSG
ncbi:MAG: hypothetical protein O7G85_00745 [Planctomycetota bacterium]|nr:hypothetical protein [Planctomycetota bacterium]